jgi:hypothetical protein
MDGMTYSKIVNKSSNKMKYIINIKHIIIIFDRMPFFVTLFIYYLLKKMKVKKNIKYLNPFQFLYDKESSHSFRI